MGDVKLSPVERALRSVVQRYDHDKYWRYRAIVTDPARGSKLGDLFRLYYIKRADAFNNASMGTHRNFGAVFGSAPRLPHGLNGIIISHNAVIGENATIFHQVTIGEGRGGAPVIGKNVLIGTGAKVIGGIRIGDNVRIGAGCTVMQDIPDNTTVIPAEPKLILRKENSNGC
jgi:serine acetyltransferase